ncbi:aldo/keto reductase [Streptomyces calidiresistens]|uniref:Aldo/keto reductase n=1 Tax=Streptomyces calidiresistens TaxID=1485586 RepID=A0A7W3XW08_9ACTN|nr:aldo/keto reductase [Streptomyces calidiresistens]MBB0229296.1 aldo/keto reductase [Streptomyces calidiresistens]
MTRTADLALGTHRCREVAAAARRAATAPRPWVDTAPNYLGGRAQRLLAGALAEHPGMGVSTKIGILPASTVGEAMSAGVLAPAATAAGHSLAPAYLRWQLARNRAELGRSRLDLVFLHNPERAGPHRMDEQLEAAFTVLEEAAAAGHITGYGVATWHGFGHGAFTVERLLELAGRAAGGRHHLRAVQLPISLVSSAPLTAAVEGRGPVHEAAAAGLEVFASSPLHGGELVTLGTPELADIIRPGLSVAAACLLTVASCPGVSTVLLGTGTTAHWAQALAALDSGPLPIEHLRSVLDVLAPTGPRHRTADA